MRGAIGCSASIALHDDHQKVQAQKITTPAVSTLGITPCTGGVGMHEYKASYIADKAVTTDSTHHTYLSCLPPTNGTFLSQQRPPSSGPHQ